jgi:hypothetical protein
MSEEIKQLTEQLANLKHSLEMTDMMMFALWIKVFVFDTWLKR